MTPNTNEARRAAKKARVLEHQRQVLERPMSDYPLMQLGGWMWGQAKQCERKECFQRARYTCDFTIPTCPQHKSTCCKKHDFRDEEIRGAPAEMLDAAYVHVEQRLIYLATKRAPSHRTRKRSEWLGRWLQLIDNEMHRQRKNAA